MPGFWRKLWFAAALVITTSGAANPPLQVPALAKVQHQGNSDREQGALTVEQQGLGARWTAVLEALDGGQLTYEHCGLKFGDQGQATEWTEGVLGILVRNTTLFVDKSIEKRTTTDLEQARTVEAYVARRGEYVSVESKMGWMPNAILATADKPPALVLTLCGQLPVSYRSSVAVRQERPHDSCQTVRAVAGKEVCTVERLVEDERLPALWEFSTGEHRQQVLLLEPTTVPDVRMQVPAVVVSIVWDQVRLVSVGAWVMIHSEVGGKVQTDLQPPFLVSDVRLATGGGLVGIDRPMSLESLLSWSSLPLGMPESATPSAMDIAFFSPGTLLMAQAPVASPGKSVPTETVEHAMPAHWSAILAEARTRLSLEEQADNQGAMAFSFERQGLPTTKGVVRSRHRLRSFDCRPMEEREAARAEERLWPAGLHAEPLETRGTLKLVQENGGLTATGALDIRKNDANEPSVAILSASSFGSSVTCIERTPFPVTDKWSSLRFSMDLTSGEVRHRVPVVTLELTDGRRQRIPVAVDVPIPPVMLVTNDVACTSLRAGHLAAYSELFDFENWIWGSLPSCVEIAAVLDTEHDKTWEVRESATARYRHACKLVDAMATLRPRSAASGPGLREFRMMLPVWHAGPPADRDGHVLLAGYFQPGERIAVIRDQAGHHHLWCPDRVLGSVSPNPASFELVGEGITLPRRARNCTVNIVPNERFPVHLVGRIDDGLADAALPWTIGRRDY